MVPASRKARNTREKGCKASGESWKRAESVIAVRRRWMEVAAPGMHAARPALPFDAARDGLPRSHRAGTGSLYDL